MTINATEFVLVATGLLKYMNAGLQSFNYQICRVVAVLLCDILKIAFWGTQYVIYDT